MGSEAGLWEFYGSSITQKESRKEKAELRDWKLRKIF